MNLCPKTFISYILEPLICAYTLGMRKHALSMHMYTLSVRAHTRTHI